MVISSGYTSRAPVITKCTVTRVGRKYFYVVREGWPASMEVTFSIDTWYEKTSYTSKYSLYCTEEEYILDIRAGKWRHKFYQTFSSFGAGHYTLEQYKQAAAIFGITLEDK
jgi:hypothetical protein